MNRKYHYLYLFKDIYVCKCNTKTLHKNKDIPKLLNKIKLFFCLSINPYFFALRHYAIVLHIS